MLTCNRKVMFKCAQYFYAELKYHIKKPIGKGVTATVPNWKITREEG